MDEVAFEKTIDTFIVSKDYSRLWDYLSAAKDEKYDEWSKERKIIYWMSFLERKSFAEEGNHGILGSVISYFEAIHVFKTIKRHMQRLEWWPEYHVQELKNLLREHGATKTEIIWIMDAYTLDSQYVLDRYNEKSAARDLFFRSELEVEELCGKRQSYLESNNKEGEKICFITCCNDDDEMAEAQNWIDRLLIPEGMQVESFVVRGANSMCAGYNDAMKKTDARYKVYLHQDVRILNPYFIFDLLDVFKKDSQIGMIGMMGADSVPDSGVMWQAKRYGAVVHTGFTSEDIAKTIHECVYFNENLFLAELVDGFLMATQVDVPWREDLFKGWDFYDASQSIEIKKMGMKVVVPKQKIAWTLHDYGQISWSGYEANRLIFVNNYIDLESC